MQASINSIDIENLRVVIEGLKADETSPAGLGAENTESSTRYLDLKPSETLPINGVPGPGWLFLIGGLSALVGSVVAFNIKPFAAQGFDNKQSIQEKLQVPVVATLNLEGDEAASVGDSSATDNGSFANRVAKLSGLFLLCVVIVIAGFVLINAEVREAFWSNPFFGCAKIVRMFAGY